MGSIHVIEFGGARTYVHDPSMPRPGLAGSPLDSFSPGPKAGPKSVLENVCCDRVWHTGFVEVDVGGTYSKGADAVPRFGRPGDQSGQHSSAFTLGR